MSTCNSLHDITHKMTRHSFPFNNGDIPKNGIYILFEIGEGGLGRDRIVRVGTHTGENQLPSRLKQHFIKQNKDRSIFRKNIGRCILHSNKDPYLNIWELDCTSSAGKTANAHLIDKEYQNDIENKISDYIQNNFSFCVLEVSSKEDRLNLESKIVSTVSLCQECRPTNKWLGISSPKDKIRGSGLWQVNELYKEPLSERDLERLAAII